MFLPVFRALREHAVGEINSGYYRVGVRKLMRNVDERRRLKNLYYEAWEKSELSAVKVRAREERSSDLRERVYET